MKSILNIIAASTLLFLLEIGDVPESGPFGLQLQLVPEAQALFGVRRRAFRRGVIIGGSVAAADVAATSAAAASASYQSAPAVAPPPVPAPAPSAPVASGKHLPLGTVVSSLPGGCNTKTVSGVAYYHCGENYYRAVFQGNNLVYVTANP